MPLSFAKALCATFLLPSTLALPSSLQPRATYPFTKLLAFGDEFSDNGNGSYAHGITGDPATVYGFGTWTNGPVAVSYLSTFLSAPLTDYAFGGCCGGANGGASFDNTYTEAGAGAPSLFDQIANYSSTGYQGIKESLGFVWVWQNNPSFHTDAFWEGDPKNAEFATTAAEKLSDSVKKLLDAGAPYVLVANIYPKHLAPVTPKYLCGTSASCVETWGKVISTANSAIEDSLVQFGKKAIYYDAFSFVSELLEKAAENGFMAPLTDCCDGMGGRTWDDCMIKGNAGKYFWMNFVRPTAKVHELIAKDMKATVGKYFGM